jgi:hypothetical protein
MTLWPRAASLLILQRRSIAWTSENHLAARHQHAREFPEIVNHLLAVHASGHLVEAVEEK